MPVLSQSRALRKVFLLGGVFFLRVLGASSMLAHFGPARRFKGRLEGSTFSLPHSGDEKHFQFLQPPGTKTYFQQ